MRTRRTAPALVPLLVLATVIPLRADEPPGLAPGVRVRITEGDALSYRTLSGTVRRLESEALTLDAESEWGDRAGTVRAIPRRRILKVEVQTRPPDRARGAVMGLAVGLLAGAAFVLVKTQLNNGSAMCDSSSACGIEVILGAALGGGIGTVVGASSAQPAWEETTLPSRGSGRAAAAAVGPPRPALSRRSR